MTLPTVPGLAIAALWLAGGLMAAAWAGSLALAIATAAGLAGGWLAATRGARAPAVGHRSRASESEDSTALVIDALSEPVLSVVDGRVKHANAAAKALLGAHIVNEDVRLAIRHPAASERLTAGAKDGGIELVGIGGRDSRVQMQVATVAPGRRIVHLIDRTTSYAAERARIDFVANASHELRTPLAAILGFIETLDDDNAGADPEVRKRFLGVMFKEARRMQRLIDDLISLSRIEAEKYQLPTQAVALGSLITEVAGELRDAEGARRPELVLAIDAEVPPVAGDRTQLSQVIHNLIGNSLKYGRPGTPVTLGLKREGRNLIRLSVADVGEGIAVEHLPRLTERFYRVDGRTRSMEGTGLGLAIVKHIVERHRGRLDITSAVGIGTTVSVLLPTVPVAAVTETSSY